MCIYIMYKHIMVQASNPPRGDGHGYWTVCRLCVGCSLPPRPLWDGWRGIIKVLAQRYSIWDLTGQWLVYGYVANRMYAGYVANRLYVGCRFPSHSPIDGGIYIINYICIYVYMYIYLCICIYVYIPVYMYICIYTCVYVYMYIYLCICTYVYMYICIYI